MCPHHGHITRIVEHSILLLVSGVMLFINNDQTKIFKGKKQG